MFFIKMSSKFYIARADFQPHEQDGAQWVLCSQGSFCPNLFCIPSDDNRGTFLFRIPDFCILQHNLHHDYVYQYILHSCSWIFCNPHPHIHLRCSLHSKLHRSIGKCPPRSLGNTADHIHCFTGAWWEKIIWYMHIIKKIHSPVFHNVTDLARWRLVRCGAIPPLTMCNNFTILTVPLFTDPANVEVTILIAA